jgi:protein-S-isoprenylcysteine O-methyltransferase Ste14
MTVATRRILPPAWFLGAVVLMSALHWGAPLYRWHVPALRWLGGALVVAGFVLTLASARLFARHGTAIKPFERSSALVTSGPYRFTRNPMYVGLVAMLAGLALLLEALSALLVVPIFAWIVATRFIAVEERMLAERFGTAYAEYRARVRRWL